MRLIPIVLLALIQAMTPTVPKAALSSGRTRADVYLPDAESGYYRGTRFDWSGMIASLNHNGHEYFGQWFERYDPKIHDAITGPVEEFLTGADSALGYADAKVGETFVRIGVGTVRKPQEAGYQRYATYEIVDPGKRTVNKNGNSIEFIHELKDPTGYAYAYSKKLRLDGDMLILEHQLKNTGTKPIETTVYDHNFFTLDHETTSPDVVVRFAFTPRAARPLNDFAEVKGNELTFLKTFEKGQTVFTEVEGFGAKPSDYDFRIENRKTGAGVRITGDRPLAKVYFWSAWKTVCPEPYIDVSTAPGKESSWRITYQFYDVKGR
jgi:hypothetical protein